MNGTPIKTDLESRHLLFHEPMGFTIEIQASYADVDVFYPYDGWEENVGDEDEKIFWKKCFNAEEAGVEEVLEEIIDRGMAEGEFLLMDPSTATIEVNGDVIENLFADPEEYEMPDPVSVLRKRWKRDGKKIKLGELQSEKFLYLKVWENGGGFRYEGDGSFESEKLTYDNVMGCFQYDGNDFDMTDGEGSSSYEWFWSGGERFNG